MGTQLKLDGKQFGRLTVVKRVEKDIWGSYKWSTPKQQARNKRNNHLITFNNKTQCLAAWSEDTGISQRVLGKRLYRNWCVAKTLITPIRKGRYFSGN